MTTFSANTPEADTWMRANYGGHTVELDPAAAKDFKSRAENAGFTFAVL